jgi:putrescine---pyruvate transaminase
MSAFLHPFAPPAKERFVTIVRGEGARVWDDTGKEYVDGMASLWYANVGYDRREVIEAIEAQLRRLPAFQCFDPFTNEPTEALAERIAALAPLDDPRVFFACSGSEAVDSAIKLARMAHRRAGRPERTLIVSRTHGYHGVTYGGTSAQGIPPNKEGWGPLVGDMVTVPGDDIEAMATLLAAEGHRVAAVITEPVQGAGGIHPPPEGYLAALRSLCDRHGAFLIMDEVICAYGRLGRWFGSEFYGVRPDLLTFAKAVTSGYQPLSGVIVGRGVREPLEAEPGWVLRHGHTYSGHPTATAAGLANLDVLEQEGLLSRAIEIGARLSEGLGAIAADGRIAGVRGAGAVWGAVLHADQDPPTVRDRLLALGVICRPIPPILAFCPPLVISDAEVDRIVDAVAEAVA